MHEMFIRAPFTYRQCLVHYPNTRASNHVHNSSLFRSLSTIAVKETKAGYPERLLVYHSGVARTVFVGWSKLTTIILFFSSCLVIAPTFYYAPEAPRWIVPAVIVGGSFPMLFVAYTTSPFVNYVHLRLPHFARRSRDQLLRWAKNIPLSTEIDITTMRFYGTARVSRMRLADLKEKKTRLGVANLVRINNDPDVKGRTWWIGRTPNRFYVGNQRSKGQNTTIWESVLEHIRKSTETARSNIKKREH